MWIFFGVSFLPLLVMTMFSYVSSYNGIREATAAEIQNTFAQMAKNLESRLNLIDSHTKNIALTIQLKQLLLSDDFDRREYSTVLKWRELDEVVQPVVYNETTLRAFHAFKGRASVYHYGGNLIDDAGFAKSRVCDDLMNSEGRLYRGIYAQPLGAGEEKFLVFGRILRDVNIDDGRPYGAIAMFLDEKAFADIYGDMKPYDGECFYIVDTGGTVVSSPDGESVAGSVADEPFYRRLAGRNGASGNFLMEVDGERVMVIYQTVPIWNYKIIDLMPADKLQVPGNRILGIGFLLFCALLIILVCVSFLLSRLLTRPVEMINRSMEALQQGEFDTKIELDGKDELGSIANSFNFMAVRLKRLVARLIDEERRRGKAELNMLQYQINPHFLHNALASIRMSSILNGDGDTAKMLQVLARLFKRVLASGGELVTVDNEIFNLKDYLYMQSLHYSNRFETEYVEDADARACLIPALLLQPLVENALYHGLNGDRLLKITITARTDGERLLLSVGDDGRGMPQWLTEYVSQSPPASMEAGDHLGIQNVINRLRLNYGDAYTFSIESRENRGTLITIIIERVSHAENSPDSG